MTARVTVVSSHSVKAEWTVTVRREPVGYLGDPEVPSPPVDDVPADIRAALLAWLKSGEGLDGCWNFQELQASGSCVNCGRPYREHV